jgi:hypothetical protein
MITSETSKRTVPEIWKPAFRFAIQGSLLLSPMIFCVGTLDFETRKIENLNRKNITPEKSASVDKSAIPAEMRKQRAFFDSVARVWWAIRT